MARLRGINLIWFLMVIGACSEDSELGSSPQAQAVQGLWRGDLTSSSDVLRRVDLALTEGGAAALRDRNSEDVAVGTYAVNPRFNTIDLNLESKAGSDLPLPEGVTNFELILSGERLVLSAPARKLDLKRIGRANLVDLDLLGGHWGCFDEDVQVLAAYIENGIITGFYRNNSGIDRGLTYFFEDQLEIESPLLEGRHKIEIEDLHLTPTGDGDQASGLILDIRVTNQGTVGEIGFSFTGVLAGDSDLLRLEGCRGV